MSQRFYFPRDQIFSDLGAIGAGYKLFTYETGTTTPLATYSDTALTSANTNPTIADSAGRFGDIFFNDAKLYKAVLKDADDNTIWTADPVDPKAFTLADFDPQPTSFWGTTAGTAAAYVLAANPTITSYSSNQTFYAACHLDNSAGSTLAIDGLTALTEKKYDGAGSKVNLEAGDKQAGQTYQYRNDGTDLVVLNPGKPYIPLLNSSGLEGFVMPYANNAAPTGWFECDGSAISRTTYSKLFAAIGTTWGIGNGSTTFNIPDLRAEFVRGWDNGKGTDSGRAFASSQSESVNTGGFNVSSTTTNTAGGGGTYFGFDANNSLPNKILTAGTETRPRNFALMYCIKY